MHFSWFLLVSTLRSNVTTIRIRLAAITMLIVGATLFHPIQQIAAQSSLEIIFLAHADDNKSGAILLQSRVHLYLSTNNSSLDISKPDEDVSDFSVSPDFSRIA